jgi:hypothetical protein
MLLIMGVVKEIMGVIGNLENIRKFGIRHFIRNEKERWSCPKCGGYSLFTIRNAFIVDTRGVFETEPISRMPYLVL